MSCQRHIGVLLLPFPDLRVGPRRSSEPDRKALTGSPGYEPTGVRGSRTDLQPPR